MNTNHEAHCGGEKMRNARILLATVLACMVSACAPVDSAPNSNFDTQNASAPTKSAPALPTREFSFAFQEGPSDGLNGTDVDPNAPNAPFLNEAGDA